jgi:hypothetical protein
MANPFAGFFGGGQGGGGGGGASPNIQIPGLQQAVDQLTQLNAAVGGLNTSLQGLANQQQRLGQQIGGMFNQIGNQAQQAAQNVNNANAAVQSTVQSTSGQGGISKLFGMASAAAGSDILKDLAMFPLRFISQTLGTNRQLSMNLQSQLSGQMFATGSTAYGPQGIAAQMARFPGNVMGSPEDLINLMGVARSAGAMMDLGSARQGSARTTGFLQAVQQMQQITPATPVGQMAGAVAQQLAPQNQQQAAQLTGGAFNMIARGGRVKSLQEWAEGILRWIEGMRPAPNTGKAFNYGELLAQYFPGSNIDAWLTSQGITPDMKEYWWNYSLGKANRTNSTQGAFQIAPINMSADRGGNQPFERLQAVAAKGRGELGLAGQMAGTYANKEQSNRWFNDLMANVQQRVIPRQTSRGALSAMQYLPDTLEELLMGMLERGGPLGALIGGGIGYGIHGAQSLAKNLIGGLTAGQNFVSQGGLDSLMQMFTGSFSAGGGVVDILSGLPDRIAQAVSGDQPEPQIGDSPGMEWGMHGTTSTAGLHPDMKRKVNAMLRANPKLRVNSGLRDTATQQNLKDKGYSRVSGKPSAHTRGLAADLGPSSQYGWITKNAGRFGLRSGKSFGEPWHVGLGDAPGVGGGIGDPHFPPNPSPGDKYPDPETGYMWTYNGSMGVWQTAMAADVPATGGTGATPTQTPGSHGSTANVYVPPTTTLATPNTTTSGGPLGGLGGLFNLFTGGLNRDTAISAIGGLVPAVMTLFMGAFGMDENDTDQSALKYDPGLYSALVAASKNMQFGGLQSQGQVGSFDYGKSFFGSLWTSGGGGGISDVLSGANSSGATTLAGALKALGKDPTGMSAGVMVAHLAHLAGFPNPDIGTVVGITNRESNWNPGVFHNDPNGSHDLSYGLAQINMLGEMGPKRRELFGIDKNEDLLDPFTNLKAMFKLSNSGTNFDPWLGYRPGIQLSPERVALGQRIAKEAGYGDIPDTFGPSSYAQYMVNDESTRRSSGDTIFHNQFVINASGGQATSGGIDVRRAVGQMADQLEAEMKNRLVRSN